MASILTLSCPAFLCPAGPRQHMRPLVQNPTLNSTPSSTRFSFRRRNGIVSRDLVHSPAAEAPRRRTTASPDSSSSSKGAEVDDGLMRRALQTGLWLTEGVYVSWLFLLPYAPGDPVWAINSNTVDSLLGLSLNFFFVLPLINTVGIHLIDAPVLHPMSEGLFNFVIAWTVMFGPLLFMDRKKDRYKGSLDVLWVLQLFLTNTFLIPYMAIRLNDADDADAQYNTRNLSQLGAFMTKGAPIVGMIGGLVCLISAFWGMFGRMDDNFGSLTDRFEFLGKYIGSERLAYAFVWDIVLYSIFQPWLIGVNPPNVHKNLVGIVNYLRFVPVVGLIAYLVCLSPDEA